MPTVNVFAQEPRLIVSMTLAARQVFLDELRQLPTPFDVVIVDEAHHLAERGSHTKRLALLGRELGKKCPDGALMLLTATPHDGKTETFLSLLRLLDPLVDNGTGQVPLDVATRLVVRRLKSEVVLAGGRHFLEPDIQVISTLGDASRQERALEAPLDAYLRWLAEEEARYAGAGARQKAKGCQFLAGVFRKRFGSSVAALRATLRRRLALPPAAEDADDDVPYAETDASDPEDDIIDPGATLENPPPPLAPGEADLARALLTAAEAVPPGRDSKLESLARLLGDQLADEKMVVCECRIAYHRAMQGRGAVAITRDDLGRRIALVRQRRGLSQAELADAVGLTQSAISRIETGERSVDSIELARLAEALQVSVLDLLEEGWEGEELGVSARAEEVRHPAALDAALSRVKELLRFDRLLDELGAPKLGERVALPTIEAFDGAPKNEGKHLAERLRDQLGLGVDPVPDLQEVIESAFGLDVALEPLPDGLSGLCVHVAGQALALADSTAVVGRQRFTIAHEACHHFVGDPSPLLVDEQLFLPSPREVRANAFAAHFLMPEEGIRRHVKDRAVDGRVVVELQYTFGVSLDALCWHLVNLRMLTEGKRRSFVAGGPKALAYQHGYYGQWQAAERLRGLVQPPLRLLRRGISAYAQGYIGIDRLAGLLRSPDAEALRRELEDLGITPDGFIPDTADD